MKNNDFDYIKTKFDTSGVNAPDSLDEQLILSKIENAQPIAAVPKKRKGFAVGFSSAAAVALVTAGAIVTTNLVTSPAAPGDDMTLFGQTAAVRRFSSRDEVKETLSNIIERNSEASGSSWWNYSGDIAENEWAAGDLSDDAANSVSGSSSGAFEGGSSLLPGTSSSSYHNSTYVQSLGVDEADTVKTDGKYIYYLDGHVLRIFTADGKQSKQISVVDSPESEDSYIDAVDFYIAGNQLILLSDCYMSDSDYDDVLTRVDIYDISNINNIRQVNCFMQSGSYISSRMIDNMLYLVSNQYIYDKNDYPFILKDQPATSDSIVKSALPQKVELPLQDVYCVDNPSETAMIVVSSVNTQNGKSESRSKAIIGSADTVYCNRENLYVTAAEYTPLTVDGDIWSNYAVPDETQIIKISLNNGLDFVASDKVGGTINNQYSLDEYNGNLRVATTSWNDNGEQVNHLYVLDQNLKQLGKVDGFAANEEIKAVRYIGDTAYVITFEQTDPLFVIDVSDPRQPQIRGEVKIDGYSSLLVPVDTDTLLGIGYSDDLNGLKLVTFDVSDKSNPQVIDTKTFDNYESAAQYNPKALLVNFERNDYTVPFACYEYDYYEALYGDEYTEVDSGVVNFRVDNGKIVVVDEYISDTFKMNYDPMSNVIDYNDVYDNDYNEKTVERCVCVGNNIYMLGGDKIDCVAYK